MILCFFGRHSWGWQPLFPWAAALVPAEAIIASTAHPERPDPRWPMHEFCVRCRMPR